MYCRNPRESAHARALNGITRAHWTPYGSNLRGRHERRCRDAGRQRRRTSKLSDVFTVDFLWSSRFGLCRAGAGGTLAQLVRGGSVCSVPPTPTPRARRTAPWPGLGWRRPRCHGGRPSTQCCRCLFVVVVCLFVVGFRRARRAPAAARTWRPARPEGGNRAWHWSASSSQHAVTIAPKKSVVHGVRGASVVWSWQMVKIKPKSRMPSRCAAGTIRGRGAPRSSRSDNLRPAGTADGA